VTLITCGNCGERVAVTALDEHAVECLRIAMAKAERRASQGPTDNERDA
jgi:hypothetical protein